MMITIIIIIIIIIVIITCLTVAPFERAWACPGYVLLLGGPQGYVFPCVVFGAKDRGTCRKLAREITRPAATRATCGCFATSASDSDADCKLRHLRGSTPARRVHAR